MCLDIPTRWNSTYIMLSVVEKYEKAFVLMNIEEPSLLTPVFED